MTDVDREVELEGFMGKEIDGHASEVQRWARHLIQPGIGNSRRKIQHQRSGPAEGEGAPS